MINLKDLYTCRSVLPFTATDTSGSTKAQGTTIIQYEVRRYRDLRNLKDAFSYQIVCTQRIIIPNASPYTPGPSNLIGGTSSDEGFFNYPAILTNQITLKTPKHVLPAEIVSYSPRTLNSSVAISVSNTNGSGSGATMQHTSGSSTSQSNSFDASASLGFFDTALTGGVTVGESHSSTSERSNANSNATQNSNSRQSSGGDSMTVKDWACYSYLGTPVTTTGSVDANISTINWVWGQEYPWDVVQYRYSNLSTVTPNSAITLPAFISDLLYDKAQMFPPSQLSQFGVDFTMKAVWLVKPEDATSVCLEHNIGYLLASHYLSGTTVEASFSNPLSAPAITSPALNVCAYGLDPIQSQGASSVAISGFIPRQFLISPLPAATASNAIAAVPFTILSNSNNLLIQDTSDYTHLVPNTDTGAGFSCSETVLSASFTPNCTALQMTVSFKVIDASSGYQLFMKHWKTGSQGCMLGIVVNGDTANEMVKYVDSLEAEGGQNNLLSISLRNLSYGSVDYHDFLQLGLNTVTITITPIGGYTQPCGYEIRALSIEQG